MKHTIKFTSNTTVREHSHGRESESTEIVLKCSCGFTEQFHYFYDKDGGSDRLIDEAISQHKIDVLLQAHGIEFEEGNRP